MQITEPVTMLTDYMIFVQSLLLCWRLQVVTPSQLHRSQQFWAMALLGIGFASLFGGTYHGLALVIPEQINHYLWKATTYCIGFVSFLIVTGTVLATLGRPWRFLLIGLSLLQLIVYLAWMSWHDDFIYVIIDYVPSMILVLVLQCLSLLKRKTGSELFMIGGVLISFAAAAVQASGFAIHRHFNHNDLYHVIQMLGIYFFYRGALKLRDYQVKDSPIKTSG